MIVQDDACGGLPQIGLPELESSSIVRVWDNCAAHGSQDVIGCPGILAQVAVLKLEFCFTSSSVPSRQFGGPMHGRTFPTVVKHMSIFFEPNHLGGGFCWLG